MKKLLSAVLLLLFLCIPVSCKSQSRNQVHVEARIYSDSTKDSVTRFRSFVVRADPYNVDVIVIVSSDYELVMDKINGFYQKDVVDMSYFSAAAFTLTRAGYPIIVWIPKNPETLDEISVVNHEILHVVTSVMLGAGIPLTKDTQEAYAYETGYLSRIFYWNFFGR